MGQIVHFHLHQKFLNHSIIQAFSKNVFHHSVIASRMRWSATAKFTAACKWMPWMLPMKQQTVSEEIKGEKEGGGNS